MDAEIGRWIEALGAHNRLTRLHAAHQLCLRAGLLSVRRALIEALRCGPEETRKMAAFTLGMLTANAESVVPHLVEALEDPSEQVRRRVLISLGEIGPCAAAALPTLEKQLQDWPRPLRELAEHVRIRIQAARPRAA